MYELCTFLHKQSIRKHMQIRAKQRDNSLTNNESSISMKWSTTMLLLFETCPKVRYMYNLVTCVDTRNT